MATSLVSTGVQFPDSTIQTTAAGAGGLTLISTTTASSSSSVVFSSLSPTAYHYYQIVAKELIASGVSQFQLQVSTDNGSTFVTTNYYSQAGSFGTSSYDTSRVINGSQIGINGAYGNGYTGHLYINLFPNPSGKYFSANGLNWAGEYFNTATGGMFSGTNAASTSAVNAVRLNLNSGTFSGIFKLYGVAA